MATQQTTLRVQKVLFALAILLFGVKIIAWFLTSSTTIYSDALESVVNVVTGGFGLYSIWLSSKPKDRNHPYGHGKVEFISAAIEGVLIALAGILIWVEVFQQFREQTVLKKLDIGIILVVLTALANLVFGLYSKRRGVQTKSLALESGGRHLISDGISTLGISVGLLVVYWTNLNWIDPVLALIMSFVLLYTGIKVVRKAVSGIMDEADDQLLDEIIQHIEDHRHPHWIDVHNLRVIKYGPLYHIDCHLTVPWYFTVQEGHEELTRLEDLVRSKFGNAVELFIHVDDCYPFSCEICTHSTCEHRKRDFKQRLTWNVDRCSRNGRHQLE